MGEHEAEQLIEGMMNAFAEESLTAPPAELAFGLETMGETATSAVAATRDLLIRVSKEYKQRYLSAAIREYKVRLADLSNRWIDLPESPAVRRDLLASVFARHPRMHEAFLTVQHRDFRALTDGDVETCLMQLADLGVLDELEP